MQEICFPLRPTLRIHNEISWGKRGPKKGILNTLKSAGGIIRFVISIISLFYKQSGNPGKIMASVGQ